MALKFSQSWTDLSVSHKSNQWMDVGYVFQLNGKWLMTPASMLSNGDGTSWYNLMKTISALQES